MALVLVGKAISGVKYTLYVDFLQKHLPNISEISVDGPANLPYIRQMAPIS